jgi:hypothetical protein
MPFFTGDFEDYSLLGYDAMCSVRSSAVCRRNILPLSTGMKALLPPEYP